MDKRITNKSDWREQLARAILGEAIYERNEHFFKSQEEKTNRTLAYIMLESAISSLSKEEQSVIKALYKSGFNYKDTCRFLEQSEKEVKEIERRALRRLKKQPIASLWMPEALKPGKKKVKEKEEGDQIIDRAQLMIITNMAADLIEKSFRKYIDELLNDKEDESNDF